MIPTAEDYINLKVMAAKQPYLTAKDWQEIIVGFAKLHLEAAKLEIKDRLLMHGRSSGVNSILDAYPLSNIK